MNNRVHGIFDRLRSQKNWLAMNRRINSISNHDSMRMVFEIYLRHIQTIQLGKRRR